MGQVDRDSKAPRKIGKKNRRERGSGGQLVHLDTSGPHHRHIYRGMYSPGRAGPAYFFTAHGNEPLLRASFADKEHQPIITVPNLQGHRISVPGMGCPTQKNCAKIRHALVSVGKESFPAIIMREILLSAGISVWNHLGVYIYIISVFWLQHNKVVTLKYILFPL